MGVFECLKKKITPTESTEVLKIPKSNSSLNEPRKDLEAQSTGFSRRKHSIWWLLGVDVPLVLILLGMIGLFEAGVIPTNKSGFFCNDTALSYPYTGDTITNLFLMTTLFISPIIIFAITETLFTEAETLNLRLKQAGINTLRLHRTYVFGILFNLGVVEVMKGIIGSPRPAFFDLCEPDTRIGCKESEYISTYKCTSDKYTWWNQLDSYRSFPSGHSSMSVYCGLFLAWYFQMRAFNWRHRSVVVVPFLQLVCISYAVVCSLTRITDHRHHWWDVLAGTGIGFLTVYYAVVGLSGNFSYLRSNSDDVTSEESQKSVKGSSLLYEESQQPNV